MKMRYFWFLNQTTQQYIKIYYHTANEMLVLLLVVASMLTLLLTRQKGGVSPDVTDTLTNRLHVSAFFVQNHAY